MMQTFTLPEIQKILWESFCNKYNIIKTQEIFWSGPNNHVQENLNWLLAGKFGAFAELRAMNSLTSPFSKITEKDFERCLGDIYVCLSLLMSLNGWELTQNLFNEDSTSDTLETYNTDSTIANIINSDVGMGQRLASVRALAFNMGLKPEDSFRKAAPSWIEIETKETENHG